MSPPISEPGQFEEISLSIGDVDQLRLEVRCPGDSNGVWGTWIEPRLEWDEKQAAPTPGIRADRVVIWNTHNGAARDRGTKRCNLVLYRGRQLVWQQTGIRVPWDGVVDGTYETPLPNLEFDRMRIELTDLAGPAGAGLGEVEVYRGSENIARKATPTSSLTFPNGYPNERFSALNINDGITNSDTLGGGSLILVDIAHGWVELQWTAPAKSNPAIKYPLKRHPEAAVPFGGRWYAFYPGNILQQDAERQCEKMGGHLPCVESAEKNEFLSKLSGRRQMWLGLQRSGDRFAWINSAPLTYQNWRPGEPHNNDGNEPYGDMLPDGLWSDAPGENLSNRGFICEWEE